jgi:hypothetical protein
MRTYKHLLQITASIVLALATMPQANAQTTDAPATAAPAANAPAKHHLFHHLREKCAADNNITLPTTDPAKKAVVKECVQKKIAEFKARKAAFKACLPSGVTSPKSMSDDQRTTFRACMTGKGFPPHQGHNRDNNNSQPNPSTSSTGSTPQS